MPDYAERSEEFILSGNPRAQIFKEAGGYDAIVALRAACAKAGVGHVTLVDLHGPDVPEEYETTLLDGLIGENATVALQAAAMAGQGHIAELASALVGLLAEDGTQVEGVALVTLEGGLESGSGEPG